MVNLFLLKEDGGFLLQENNGKIILGVTDDDEGGGSGGKSTAFGHSLVKKQLANKFVEKIHHIVIGKLLLKSNIRNAPNVQLTITPQPRKLYTLESIALSKLIIHEKFRVKSTINSKESFIIRGKVILHESALTKSRLKKHPMYELANCVYTLSEMITKNNISQMNLEKAKERKTLLKLKQVLLEDIRKTPQIQVSLNTGIHQRGDLMRITTHMSEQSGQIWMRIIDSKGMIVQKAGLVKNNATGFQILVGTRDLEAGKYTVQVSNHNTFSPLGVAEFQVKGTAPIAPFVPVIPFLLTPDSPTGKFERHIFRTMQDSRVDDTCKKFENKKFKFGDKTVPIPPLHINCRCWIEGIDEK